MDEPALGLQKKWSELKTTYDPKGANQLAAPLEFNSEEEEQQKRIALYYIFEKLVVTKFFTMEDDSPEVKEY